MSASPIASSLSPARLQAYLHAQLAHWFPDAEPLALGEVVPAALERTARCFAPVKLPMYQRDGAPYFDHLHSDQYATFLYFASNTAHELGDRVLAAKIYGLNKSLNGFMCTYDTVLPPHFLIIHTVGMLLGKATYGDYFVALHGVTIGTDRGVRPVLGEGVIMYGGSSVIGDCAIGDRVSIAAHALIRNQSIAPGHVVAGTSPDLLVKPSNRPLIEEFFT